MYLLDTYIVSETRKPRPHPAVLAWIRSVSKSEMFLPAVTLGELQKGVEITRRQDLQKAAEIGQWIDRLASAYEILAADELIFREWARLMRGRSNSKWEDGLIAATARIHRLIVVTRNARDFEGFGVEVFSPFPTAPEGQD
ncbi:MAG: type II toxin-antitoxin system VapC family toxin [Terracidiphilus sp.]|jgi:predicted nucleic acid-binding protein